MIQPGMMFGGEGPVMQGTWYNPNTGDAFTVRDSFFEDNQYVVTTTDDAYFASLIAEQDNNYELLCDQNYEILAESTYSQEDKVEALETLSKLETKRNKENIIKELILGKGHPSCFIEIKDDTVYVYIKSKPTDNKSIVEIMELVDSILPNSKIYIKYI